MKIYRQERQTWQFQIILFSISRCCNVHERVWKRSLKRIFNVTVTYSFPNSIQKRLYYALMSRKPLKETRNSFKKWPLNLWWISNKIIMEVRNIAKATNFKSFLHHAITFFMTVLFKFFMRHTLPDYFWGLHKNMNCAFPLTCLKQMLPSQRHQLVGLKCILNEKTSILFLH